MDDCSAEYAKIKIVLLRWARVSVPIWAGYVGQCGGQGAHLDKIWQMYWQPVHHRGAGNLAQIYFVKRDIQRKIFLSHFHVCGLRLWKRILNLGVNQWLPHYYKQLDLKCW